MVGSGHVVKLGDFGMARAMYDSDYYRFGRKGEKRLNEKNDTMKTFPHSFSRKTLTCVFLLEEFYLIN